MTTVPTALLPDRITIEAQSGVDGMGRPIYAQPVTVRARVEGKRRTVRRSDGTDVISSASAIVRPSVEVAPESRVVHDGRTYEVLDVLAGQGLSRPAYRELVLE